MAGPAASRISNKSTSSPMKPAIWKTALRDLAPVVAPWAVASGRRLFGGGPDEIFEPEADGGGVEVGDDLEQDVGTAPKDIVDVAQVLVVSNVAGPNLPRPEPAASQPCRPAPQP